MKKRTLTVDRLLDLGTFANICEAKMAYDLAKLNLHINVVLSNDLATFVEKVQGTVQQ